MPVSGTRDLCGYDTVDYEGTFRVVLRESIDETGTKRSHYLEPFQLRVRGVGQTTGEVWIGSSKSSFANNYIDGDEPQTFNLVQQTKWVGLGQAPDFVSTFRGHLTINGNGELVLFRVDFTPACD
jgi:hypothetical protein